MSIIKRLAAIVALAIISVTTLTISPAAADVAVSVNGKGDLIITGTDGPESIKVTTINNHIVVSVKRNGIITGHDVFDLERDIIVNLKGGTDYFAFANTEAPRDLKVTNGNGDGALLIVENSVVDRNLKVTDGNGSTTAVVSETTVNGKSTFKLGGGDHVVNLRDNTWTKAVSVSPSSSGSMDMDILRDWFLDDVKLTFGNGSEKLRVSQSVEFSGKATIDLKGGNDNVHLLQSEFTNRLTLKLGSGNDSASINNMVFFNRYTIDLGSGHDLVGISWTDFTDRGTINGRSGSDTLGLLGVSQDKPMKLISIEGGYGF